MYYLTRIVKKTFAKIGHFLLETFKHLEAVTILAMSSIGLSYIFYPYIYYLWFPSWISMYMLGPVAGVMVTAGLVHSMERRMGYRNEFPY